MDYVDWCSKVLQTVINAMAISSAVRNIGVEDSQLEMELFGSSSQQPGSWQNPGNEALHDALRDLTTMGFLQTNHNVLWKVTSQGREYMSDPLPWWEFICSTNLIEDQEQLLLATNQLSADESEFFARVSDVTGEALAQLVPWLDDQIKVYSVLSELKEGGFLEGDSYAGDPPIIDAHSTLKGLIWETRRKFTRESREIDRLVAEWETTSVEFKQQLALGTNDEKAEFIKDVLGLVTTKASSPRLFIIGFKNTTHDYHGAPDASVTQNRIEQILAAYTDPIPEIRYKIADYLHGSVGVLEGIRDPEKLPYKVAKSLTGDKRRIVQGQIFVRHGSQTEEPTPVELQALIDEGKRARGESVNTP